MKNGHWFILFFLVVAGDITGILWEDETLQFIFKPLIVPVISLAFLQYPGPVTNSPKHFILFALFFSWVGDILLIFDARNELFFLAGLSSFLVAHLFYIAFFYRIQMREKIRSNGWLMVIVAVYYTSLILLLADKLGDKEWPVRIYGIVISFMLLLALHLSRLRDRRASGMMVAGAVLFVISDSLLAINKFLVAFEAAGMLVMLSYAFAQWLIAMGAAQYLKQSQNI